MSESQLETLTIVSPGLTATDETGQFSIQLRRIVYQRTGNGVLSPLADI
jgi:hypothetical protein